MNKPSLYFSLALLIGLMLSLFPQDSEEAKVIFVLTHGRISSLKKEYNAKKPVSEDAGGEKPTSEVDGEAEEKRRKKRRRKKARINRELFRWLKKRGKTIPKWLRHFIRRHKKRRRLMKTKPIAVHPRLKSMFKAFASKNSE